MKRIFASFIVAAVLSSAAAAQSVPQFKSGDVVALVGDSITHGGHYHSYIWLYYMTRFPDMQLTFLNCGVGGDTADSMEYRFMKDVLAKNPTYITLTFGMNDTGYWNIYNHEDSQRLSDAQVASSLSSFAKIEQYLKDYDPDARIAMIGGSPYDETSTFNDNVLKGKNAAICRIIEGQKAAAESNGWGFVDFNEPMVKIAGEVQKNDPAFSFSRQDRIHPDQDGQMVMAYLFLKAQGLAGRKVAHVCIDARKKKVDELEYCKVSDLQVSDGSVSFDYLAESLPYPCDSISEHGWANVRSQRDAMELVPFMEEFNQEILKVCRLKEGTYRLTIDGVFIDDLSSEELDSGVNLASYVNTPQYRQASAIMYMNEERFDMEKRMREYVWMHTNMFRGTDKAFVDDSEGLDKISKEAHRNGFVGMSLYWYRKSYFPEIREVWQDYMDKLVETIYTINKPQTRKVRLERL